MFVYRSLLEIKQPLLFGISAERESAFMRFPVGKIKIKIALLFKTTFGLCT